MDMKLLTVTGLLALGISGCSNVKPCDSRPGLSTNCKQSTNTVVPVEPPVVPEPDPLVIEDGASVIGKNSESITSVTFDSDTNTITVEAAGFDGFGEYARRADIDSNGNDGFESTRGQRSYLAFNKDSDSGAFSTSMVTEVDYREIADHYVIFRRTEGEIPAGGFTNYEGKYHGSFHGNDDGFVSLVQGDILIEVDFTDGYTEGLLSGREVYATVDTDDLNLQLIVTPEADNFLPSYGLRRGSLNANGVYSGSIVDSDGANVGTYKGAIGGVEDVNTPEMESALETAGVIEINTGGATEVGTYIANCVTLADGDTTVCP